jgi:hypothetical protein
MPAQAGYQGARGDYSVLLEAYFALELPAKSDAVRSLFYLRRD